MVGQGREGERGLSCGLQHVCLGFLALSGGARSGVAAEASSMQRHHLWAVASGKTDGHNGLTPAWWAFPLGSISQSLW